MSVLPCRRDCLRALALALPGGRLLAGALFPTTVADRVDLRFRTPGPRPMGIKATRNGLWLVDGETAKAYRLDYGGTVKEEIETGAVHPTAVEADEVGLWIAADGGRKLIRIEFEHQRRTRSFDLPGVGPVKWGAPGTPAKPTGIQGLAWQSGELFAASPADAAIYVVKVQDGSVARKLPAPGVRPQGLAWDPDGSLWCAEADSRSFFKMEPATGRIIKQHLLPFAAPLAEGKVIVPHGLTIWQRRMYFCSPATGSVYRTPVVSRLR